MLYTSSKYFKTLSLCLMTVFSLTSIGISNAHAAIAELPQPGSMLGLSENEAVPLLKGLRFDPNDPLNIQFVINKANGAKVSQDEATKLVNYFLTSLTVSQEDIWVNLSPYESDRIMDNELAETELGQELLEQDYILKQLSASITHPDTEIGADYWKNIADKTDAFNKIWIMPDEVEVFEGANAAYVTKATMKVMTDADFQAMKNNQVSDAGATNAIKNTLLPKIADDVNNGKNFSSLRQVYNAIVLANWFKAKFRDSFYSFYFDSEKTAGLDLAQAEAKEKIYGMYVEAFKKGAYDFIKKEYDADLNAKVKKHYFSGGIITQSSAVITNDPDRVPNLDAQVFNVKTQILDENGQEFDERAKDYNEDLESDLYKYGYRDHVSKEDKNKEERLNKNLLAIENFLAELDSNAIEVDGQLLVEFVDKVQAFFEKGYLVTSKKKYMLEVYELMLDYYTQFVELDDQSDIVDQLLVKTIELGDFNYVYNYVVQGHYVNDSLFEKTLMHFSVTDANKAVLFQEAQEMAMDIDFITAADVKRDFNAERMWKVMKPVIAAANTIRYNPAHSQTEVFTRNHTKAIKQADKLILKMIKKAKKGYDSNFFRREDMKLYENYLNSYVTGDSLSLFMQLLSYDRKASNYLFDLIYNYQTSDFLMEKGLVFILNSIAHGGTSKEYSKAIYKLIKEATGNEDLAFDAFLLVNRSELELAIAEDRKKFSSAVNAAILRNNSDLVIGFMDSLVVIEDDDKHSKILTDYKKAMGGFAKRLKKSDTTAVFYVKEYSDYYQGFATRADYALVKILFDTLAYDSEATEFIYENIDIIASEDLNAAVKILERTVKHGAYVYAQNARELLDNVYTVVAAKNTKKAAKLVDSIEIKKESSAVEEFANNELIDGGISFDGVASNITAAAGSSAIQLPMEMLDRVTGIQFKIIDSADYDDLRTLYTKTWK